MNGLYRTHSTVRFGPLTYRVRGRVTPLLWVLLALFSLLFLAGWFSLANWVFMLIIGGLHSIWPATFPALGFWQTTPITGVVYVLLWLFRRPSR